MFCICFALCVCVHVNARVTDRETESKLTYLQTFFLYLIDVPSSRDLISPSKGTRTLTVREYEQVNHLKLVILFSCILNFLEVQGFSKRAG